MQNDDAANIANIRHYAERGLVRPDDIFWLISRLFQANSTIAFLEHQLNESNTNLEDIDEEHFYT